MPIRIERIPIQVELAFGVTYGHLGGDHLMLVLQLDPFEDGRQQHNWFVMEGTRDVGPDGAFTIGLDGADGFTTMTRAFGVNTAEELAKIAGTPFYRGSRILESENPFGDWETMAVIGRDLESQTFPYYVFNWPGSPLPTSNSSSMVASILYYMGVDIAQNMPFQLLSFTTGTHTLLGTSQDDELTIEWSFDTLFGGEGNDLLKGRDDFISIDKLYGGAGLDILKWSNGRNVMHGGQPGMSYDEDGTDAVDYNGVGAVHIEFQPNFVEHLVPTFYGYRTTGFDEFFSIEQLRFSDSSDTITIGEGVHLQDIPLLLDMRSQDADGPGDKVDFSPGDQGLLIVPSDNPEVVRVGAADPNTGEFDGQSGIWVKSAEWLVGSAGDDRIFAASEMRIIEGGKGNDTLDARYAAAFANPDPEGFDLELDGGDGDDIIVSGAGRILARGGDGSNTFILSSLSTVDVTGQFTELVIDGANSSDKLFVPYNFLKPGTGAFEDSGLLQIRGGVKSGPGTASFADLPQVDESGSALLSDFYFVPTQTQHDFIFNSNTFEGVLDFAGRIAFTRDGSDLLVHIFSGEVFPSEDVNAEGETYTYVAYIPLSETETIIRVRDFSEGDLGIQFYTLTGESYLDYVNYQGPGTATIYDNWDTIVDILMNGGRLEDPAAPAPQTPVYDFPEDESQDQRERIDGTDGDDLLIASLTPPAGAAQFFAFSAPVHSSGSDLNGGEGNDTLIGSDKRDQLDGGPGDDLMSGGRGNDTYIVDSAGDTVVELAGEGRDTVIASIDFTLPEHVENLQLTGSAVMGIGNALRNTITGNDGDNVLIGGQGDDTLYGGGGNDLLVGGEGSDGYVYLLGGGTDTIVDDGSPDDIDVLLLVGIDPSTTRVFLAPGMDHDVMLRIADGGRVILRDFILGHSIEELRFDDQSVWDRAQILSLAVGAGVLVNDAPVARDDGLIYTYLSEITLPAIEFLGNDSDADGDPLSIVGVSTTSLGASVHLTASGDVTVALAAGQYGLVEIAYTVSDGRGGTASAEAGVLFLENAAPVVLGGAIPAQFTPEDHVWSFTLPANAFSDADGDPLFFEVTLADGNPLPAWLSYEGETRTLNGTPPENFNGAVDLKVTAYDGLQSAQTEFRLNVTPVNDAPVARDDSGYSTRAGIALTLTAAQLLANDSDVDGDQLVVIAVGETSGGSVALEADGRIVFTPAAGFTGTAAFRYQISDGNGGEAFAEVTIEVEPGDTPVVIISGTSGDDVLRGTKQSDTIDGGAGNDRLYGFGGDDVFLVSGNAGLDFYWGGAGSDRIQGSSGNDIIGLSAGRFSSRNAEIIDGGSGYDVLRLSDQGGVIDLSKVQVISIERIEGGRGNDRIIGSSGNDTIDGKAGNDRLYGGAGNDTITGGPGNDRMWGDAGNDTFLVAGNSGQDRFNGGSGYDRIVGSSGNDVLYLARGDRDLVSIEAIDLGGGVDTIRLGPGSNTLDLSRVVVTGAEKIDLGAGNDRFVASAASEAITGGSGKDTFVFKGTFGHDRITDFQISTKGRQVVDRIDFSDAGIESFAALMDRAAQVGKDTVITIDQGSSVRLLGVKLKDLGPEDFIL